MTLPKILLILVIVWLAWTLLKRHNIVGGANRNSRPSPGERPQKTPTERAIEDMVKCPKCGAYVPVKGGHDCAHG